MLHIYGLQANARHERTNMLLDENKSIFDTIASWWGYIFAVGTALVIIWRATKKTGLSGWNVFKVIKRFTDAAAAVTELRNLYEEDKKRTNNQFEYLHAKIDVLSDGFTTPQFRADVHGNFVDVNEAFCQMFQKTLDELEGDGWTQIFSKDDRATSLAAWDRAILRKIKFSQVFRVLTAGHISKLVKMRAFPLFDGEGNLKEFIGSIVLIEEKQ